MAGNKRLADAKKNKNDEFYTQLSVIEEELRHYKHHFKNKVILCNCDDPYESYFFKYFALNYNSLGLKKLITTGYVTSPIIGTELNVWTGEETEVRARTPYVAFINKVADMNGDGRIDLEDIKILLKEKHNFRRKLHGDDNYPAGDFRSKECIKLLKQADIIITNPPFSLFREYIHLLVKYDKKFIIMGNKNAITYKEFFPLLKDNKVWVGATSLNGGRWMIIPKGMEFDKKEKAKINDKGETIFNVAGVCWFTNLDIKKRHEDLILYKNYNPKDYPKFDNYDAINVDDIKNIPCDYDGVMGVPITFMNKYNPSQFEILDITKAGAGNPAMKTKEYPRQIQVDKNGKRSSVTKLNDGADIIVDSPPIGKTYYIVDDVMYIQTYPRILIRKKNDKVIEKGGETCDNAH